MVTDIYPLLQPKEAEILASVKGHAERLLNHTPRFRFFTLHGSEHLDGLFRILALMLKGGVKMGREELFLLAVSICIHDLGMVVSLRDTDLAEILEGKPAFADPASFENYVRDTHHELVAEYCKQHFNFLTDLGLTPTQVAQVIDISRCHRKVDLESQSGAVKFVGALLRIIDELDISAHRAPADVLLNNYDSMDPISCWHWFKHNITDDWLEDHTVFFEEQNGRRRILFRLVVRPPKEQSIGYWLNQVHRPLKKALYDDGAQKIVKDKYGIEIEVQNDPSFSSAGIHDRKWLEIEERALSQNRKVVLVIDDEFRKLEDNFFPLMDHFHVIPAFHAKDALAKLSAARVDLAIVDMQIGSGGIWSDIQTQDYKATGILLCEAIRKDFPKTRLGVLTGTKHTIPPLDALSLSFNLRKPVNPKVLLQVVTHALA